MSSCLLKKMLFNTFFACESNDVDKLGTYV